MEELNDETAQMRGRLSVQDNNNTVSRGVEGGDEILKESDGVLKESGGVLKEVGEEIFVGEPEVDKPSPVERMNVLQGKVVNVEAVEMSRKSTNNKRFEGKREQVKSLEKQISGMSRDLECRVCLNLCSPPIYSFKAQHPVCSECRSTLKECAECREPFNKQEMIRHRYVMTSCNYLS